MVCRPYALLSNCADLLLTTWPKLHFMDNIQTRQYRCPEVTLHRCKMGNEREYMGCRICNESCTNMPAYRSIIDPCMLYVFELITGSYYLFDPADGSRYSKNDDRIAQIIKLMGEIPKFITFASKYS